MALDPLATKADLLARINPSVAAEITDGSPEETRALTLLVDASAAVRRYTRQQITAATDTVRLAVRNGKVTLPQRPVTAVTAVQDINGNDVEFTWETGDKVLVAPNVPDTWAWNPWRNGITHVDVTYDHGYDEIPGDIIAVVCQAAARAYGRPADETGVTSETVAGYSYTIGAAAAAGAVGLLPDERAVLDDYRSRGGMATLA